MVHVLLKRGCDTADINGAQFFAGLFPSGQTFNLLLLFIGVHKWCLLFVSLQFLFSIFFFRPDLKVILMSATLNSEMFSAYFGMKNHDYQAIN